MTRRTHAPAWQALSPAAGAPVLVFGMDWAAMMGSDPHGESLRRARSARATHCVAASGQAAVAGWARLPRELRGQRLHAAALAYAGLHPRGASAGILALPGGRAWLVAAQAGSVLPGGDRLCADADEAMRLRAALAARHPGLEPVPLELADLAAGLAPANALAELGGRWRGLPLPVRVAPLLLAAAYAVQHGPALWRDLSAGRQAAPRVDPLSAWQQALGRAAGALPVHTEQDAAAVLGSLRRLPLALRGWSLRRAACDAAPGGWSCSASYLRAARTASNDGLARALPPGWQASFRPLDEAVLAWRVPAGGAGLDPAQAPSARQTDIAYASRLQALQPAFARIGLGQAQPIAVPAPGDDRGAPLPRPAGLPELQSRPLSVQGPLRSFALLARQLPPGAWRQLALEISPDQPARLASSRLVARLQGVLYEKR